MKLWPPTSRLVSCDFYVFAMNDPRKFDWLSDDSRGVARGITFIHDEKINNKDLFS